MFAGSQICLKLHMNETLPAFTLDLVWTNGRQPNIQVDPQLFALLEAIRRTRKLTDAAAKVGLHYRQAWGLITSWSDALGQPLVLKERGKGTSLTALGESLLQAHGHVRDKMAPHLAKAVRDIDQKIAPLLNAPADAVRMIASHDLLLMEFRNLLQTRTGPKLDVQIAGSLGGIAALCKSHCDIAGFHFPEGELGQNVLREFKPWLRPRSQVLVHFVRRTQGLIVARGNPLNIRSISDIIKTKSRFINRQRGSGTQIALDLLLEREGLDKRKINGYSNEEYTHAAIASAVASGVADVGLGIETVARKLNIGFVPLFAEDYYLLFKRDALERKDVQGIVAILKSKAFRKISATLSGYDVSRSGTIIELDNLITKQ
ncbi:molybdopterin binding domain-containing protein [Bradyrhizobiaceae bacterium SG-6C]|nr:molybdopterin binding domain-containing protein [Bradyrhizobiaceae bacterium SG-6C]